MNSPASPSTSTSTATSVQTVGHLVSFDGKNRSDVSGLHKAQVDGNISLDEFNKRTEAPPKVPLLPLTTADVMDCFRLYFGTNVTMFPFYASRLGAVGIAVTVCVALLLNTQTQKALHRARYNLVLAELYKRLCEMPAEAKGMATSPEGATPTTVVIHINGGGFDESSSVSGMDALNLKSCKSEYSTTPTSPQCGAQKLDIISSAEAALSRLETLKHNSMMNLNSPTFENSNSFKNVSSTAANSTCAGDATMVPYFTEKLGTLAKASDVLWPTHWIKKVISACTILAQFSSACCFVMLFASNMAPVLGISTSNSVYLCSVAMGVLTLATSYKARTLLAYGNNLFIFAGAALLLVASLAHEKSEEEAAMPLQLLPKSFSQVVIYVPSVVAYLAPQLVTIDTETVVSDRVYKFYQEKNSPSGQQLSDSPDVLIGSLGVVNMLRQTYIRALHIGALLSGLVLLFFAEILMWIFRDNTNDIITLSLPESALRTMVLITLSAGLYVCGALNVNPISNLMDTFVQEALKRTKTIQPIFGMIASRVAFFVVVAAFLHIVPFFDLVAAFSGAIITPIFVFFVPAACELQSQMVRAAVETHQQQQQQKQQQDGSVNKDTHLSSPSLVTGWRRMPHTSKILAVLSVIFGTLIMCLSTGMVIDEVIRRRSGAQ